MCFYSASEDLSIQKTNFCQTRYTRTQKQVVFQKVDDITSAQLPFDVPCGSA